MANLKFYQSSVYMGGAELQNPRIHNLSSSPSTGKFGQMYYNTTDNSLYVCYSQSPVAWKKVGSGGAVVEEDGTNSGITVTSSASSTDPGVTIYKLKASGITSSHINSNAGILFTQLQAGTANKLLVTSSTGVVTTSANFGINSSGHLTMGSKRITSLANPSADSDAVNFSTLKAWFSGNVDIHAACDVATTTNLPSFTGIASIDGVDLATIAGQGSEAPRVLVNNQTDPKQNGIYVWSSANGGTLTRASDCDANGELFPGSTTYIKYGDTWASSGFVQKDSGGGTGGTIRIGTDGNNWTQSYAIAKIQAGAGLTRTGNEISVNYNSTLALDSSSKLGIATVTVTSSGSAAASKTLTAFTVNSYGQVTAYTFANISIAASQISSGTLGVARGGTGQSTYAKGEILYASAANTLGKLGIGSSGKVLLSDGSVPTWSSLADAGIASAGHNHDSTYLKLSGGTITGPLGINSTLTISTFGAGVLHSNASGVISSSAVSLTADVSGILPLANGGTNKDLSSATNWGVVYKASDGFAVTGQGSANHPLVGAGSAAPKFAGYTLPASISANKILVATSTTAIGVTNVLPFTLGIAQGGTGGTTAAAARVNLQVPHVYTADFNDWSQADKTLTHGLGTDKMLVQVFEKDSSTATYYKIEVGLTITSTTLTLSAVTGIMSGKNIRVCAVAIES